MTISFSNFSRKIPKYGIFGSQQTLILYKSEGANFKYDKSFWKFQPKNTQIKHFRSQI